MKYYTVGGFNKTSSINMLGHIIELELSWIDGQVGAMPVFDDYIKVSEYAQKHNYQIIMFETKEQNI